MQPTHVKAGTVPSTSTCIMYAWISMLPDMSYDSLCKGHKRVTLLPENKWVSLRGLIKSQRPDQ